MYVIVVVNHQQISCCDVCVCACACVYLCARKSVCLCVCVMRISSVYICVYVCVHVHACMCIYVQQSVFVSECMCMWCIFLLCTFRLTHCCGHIIYVYISLVQPLRHDWTLFFHFSSLPVQLLQEWHLCSPDGDQLPVHPEAGWSGPQDPGHGSAAWSMGSILFLGSDFHIPPVHQHSAPSPETQACAALSSAGPVYRPGLLLCQPIWNHSLTRLVAFLATLDQSFNQICSLMHPVWSVWQPNWIRLSIRIVTLSTKVDPFMNQLLFLSSAKLDPFTNQDCCFSVIYSCLLRMHMCAEFMLRVLQECLGWLNPWMPPIRTSELGMAGDATGSTISARAPALLVETLWSGEWTSRPSGVSQLIWLR